MACQHNVSCHPCVDNNLYNTLETRANITKINDVRRSDVDIVLLRTGTGRFKMTDHTPVHTVELSFDVADHGLEQKTDLLDLRAGLFVP